MKLNYNWGTVASLSNLASWFRNKERELRSAAAHNHHAMSTRHQPGGTGIVCRHEFLQYAWNPPNNFQGVGRWYSWWLYCNPTHSTRPHRSWWRIGPAAASQKGCVQYINNRFVTYNCTTSWELHSNSLTRTYCTNVNYDTSQAIGSFF